MGKHSPILKENFTKGSMSRDFRFHEDIRNQPNNFKFMECTCKNTMDSGSENNTNKEKSKVSIILYLSSGRTKTLGKVNILT